MTEAQLQTAIIHLARLLQWRVCHFRAARTAHGWATPVQADGAGFPDLTMVRNGHLIFAELKTTKGRVSPAQRIWLDQLGAVTFGADRVQVFEWRPDHWTSGVIETILKTTGSRLEEAA